MRPANIIALACLGWLLGCGDARILTSEPGKSHAPDTIEDVTSSDAGHRPTDATEVGDELGARADIAEPADVAEPGDAAQPGDVASATDIWADTTVAQDAAHDTGTPPADVTAPSDVITPADVTAPQDVTPPPQDTTPPPQDTTPPQPPAPWPPPELTNARPHAPRPSGNGWRSAQWNICTTSSGGSRLECRTRIHPSDTERTAAMLERAAIARVFLEDRNMYSFTLQEVCEMDARWVAAFVANQGPPAAGWNKDFSAAEYQKIDERAPYAFLPYVTRELSNGRDYGCGAGIATGVAAIAKRVAGTSGLKLWGLTNATYAQRATSGFTRAHLTDPEVCKFYFEAQTSYTPVNANEPDGRYKSVNNFRTNGCTSSVPATLRGLACVRTRWQGPGDSTHYRVSTCGTHAVHKGLSTFVVRNRQIDEAGPMMEGFAGGSGQRSILSGDFNVVARRGKASTLTSAEAGHATILEAARHGFTKVTAGRHTTSSNTGTFRSNCSREIDAIYARNAWWLKSSAPNTSPCRTYPDASPPAQGTRVNPFDWSDHEMTVSPLMAPTGSGASDL